VTTIEDEIQRRKMSEAKGRAVQSELLVPMYFESDLVDGYRMPHFAVDKEMVKGCNEARTAANHYIEAESKDADGTLATKVLNIKEKVLTALDRTFRVEICFMDDMAGGAGQTILLSKVSDALPSPTSPYTPAQTLCELSSLFASQLYSFPNKQARQSAAIIRSAVTQISLGRRPVPLDSKCSSAVHQCYEKMANYLTHSFKNEEGHEVTVFGKKALDMLHAAMKQTVTAGTPALAGGRGVQQQGPAPPLSCDPAPTRGPSPLLHLHTP
jgi:hypothetical protein